VPSLYLHTKKNTDTDIDTNTYMYGGDYSTDGFYRKINNKETNNLVQYHYKKNNIDVYITGSYDNVYSLVFTLDNTTPIKQNNVTRYFGDSDEYSVSADNNLLTPDDNNNIKYRRRDGNHIYLTMDNKEYSGSGILLCIRNKDEGPYYYILFKSSLTNNYDDLGGKINRRFTQNKALFENAKNVAKTNTNNMFSFNSIATKYIDIKSNIGNTYYRVYIYKLVDENNDINSLIHRYNERLTNDSKIDGLSLFECKRFDGRIQDEYNYENISSGIFPNYDNKPTKVNGRCIKVIRKIDNFDSLSDITINSGAITGDVNTRISI
jgi:hypothetical protein